jgi:GTPase SAR1 family protein
MNTAWIQPVSVDPTLLVGREAERERLVRKLQDHLEGGYREARLLVVGPRGVGKSILTHAALRELERRSHGVAVCVTVDSRGLRYRPFLNLVARALVEGLRPKAAQGRRESLLLWLDQLALLASGGQVTEAQTETVGRRYGVEAAAEGGLLWKLASRFTWEEQRSLGTTVQRTLTVTDDLLQGAIVATLELLRDEDLPWYVVLFFNDLDQAVIGDQASDAEELYRKVMDLRPCISIAHYRSEVHLESVTRGVEYTLDLRPLDPATLVAIRQRRLAAAPDRVRTQFPPGTDWSAPDALARCTGIPLVYLRWLMGLLDEEGLPPRPGWTELPRLDRIVRAADFLGGVDSDLLARLVGVMERCDGGDPEVQVGRDDLARGTRAPDSAPAVGLSDQDIEDLVRMRVLVPRHRYLPSQGLRVQPFADLLRPSRRALLASSCAR